MSMMKNKETFYLVHEQILPEALLKTIQAKELLAKGSVKTINEAVEVVGLSRSAFYKYKDGIFPLNKMDKERIITISMNLDHRSGILSKVLALIADFEGNVLTIHQTIPLQGMANVVVSVDIARMARPVDHLTKSLHEIDGVHKASIIGQG